MEVLEGEVLVEYVEVVELVEVEQKDRPGCLPVCKPA